MGKRSKALRAMYFAGTALLLAGMAVGVLVSLRRDRRLPAVRLAEAVEGDLAEIGELLERGEHETAIERLRVAQALMYRRREVALEMLGRAYVAAGRPEDAVAPLRQALALRPGFAEAHNELGVAYARLGRFDQAIGSVREALRLDPGLAPARRNLALMEERARRPEVSSPTSPDAGPDVTEGRAVTRQLYRGEIEALHARLDPAFGERMSLAALRDMRGAIDRQLGAEVQLLDERVEPLGDGTRLYVRRARFEKVAGDVEVLVQLGGERGVRGLKIQPAAEPQDHP